MRFAFLLCVSLYAQSNPCSSPAHHSLDFLLGDWEVHDARNRLMGWSRFTSLAGSCAILEHWRGVRGGEGTGLFFYDAPAQRWRREYVGPGFIERNAQATIENTSEGAAIAFTATADQALMKYRYARDAQGPYLLDQESTDGGRTWTPPERRSLRPLPSPHDFTPKAEIALACSAPEFRPFVSAALVHSKGCVFLELPSATNDSILRFTYYDPAEKVWIQQRDSPRGHSRHRGSLSNGALVWKP